jgi:glycosyltransferase involved in cell wall biosynthesis
MRIGFDARYIQDRYHGIGRYAFELLGACIAQAPDDRFIVFWDPRLANSRFPLAGLLDAPNVIPVAIRLPLFGPLDQLVLPFLARRHRLDLLHVPYIGVPLAVPCPLVLTIYDLIFERYPAYMPQLWARGYYNLLTRGGLLRARGVLVLSAATERDLLEYYPVDPRIVRVTPPGASPAFGPPSTAQIAAARARYGLPERFILVVAARRPHKNVEVVVEALDQLRERLPHALVLVGGHDARFPDPLATSPAAARLAGRIKEIGPVAEEDMPAVYGAAAACVCPSLIEGFGLPVLEALACGVPTASSGRASLAEVAGDAALLFDPTDVRSLADALLRLLGDDALRHTLRERGLARARTFSWSHTATATLGLYRHVARQRAG